MFEINFYDLGTVDHKELTRVVCVCKYKGKYVFSYNKKRNGWEIPGGHIEEGETWQEAAKREMFEETGATRIKVTPISIYKISTYGLLCYCEIEEIGDLSKEYEMEKIMLSDTLPDRDMLTFPDSFKLYFDLVNEKINE
ncbi:MAG: NUDIX domain-containing protein [Mollicutes bacterium]|nr:NUDIX domain-containing protein [Mollicutes bacterium]